MPKIPYSVLAPIVRALVTRVETRPAPAAFVVPCFADVERRNVEGPEEDDAPPTQRRAA